MPDFKIILAATIVGVISRLSSGSKPKVTGLESPEVNSVSNYSQVGKNYVGISSNNSNSFLIVWNCWFNSSFSSTIVIKVSSISSQ